MKKLFSAFLAFCFLLSPCPAFAAEETPEPVPKLIVTGISVPNGSLNAGESAKVTVKIKNMSRTVSAEDIRIAVSDAQGGITKNGSGYIREIRAGRETEWTMNVNVLSDASSGNHCVTLSMDYSSEDGQGASCAEVINIAVKGKAESEKTPEGSLPRAMVTDYGVESGCVIPGESRTVTVKIKNTSSSKAMKSIKLSIAEASGELIFEGTGSIFIKSIGANCEYEWKIPVTAANTAKSGEHEVAVTAEYESDDGTVSTSTDTIRISVRQPASLEYSGAALPTKLVQGDASSISVTFMNTGKSVIYNCIMRFDVEKINTGGSVLVGTIEPGESKNGSVTVLPDSDALGEISGTLLISYEDDNGQKFEESVAVSSVIREKVTLASSGEKEEEKSSPWWLFLLIGTALGGGIGTGISLILKKRKERKEDEKRL